MKKCADCKLYKEVTDFPKSRNRKDGYHPYCKICHETRNKKYLANNRIRRLEYERTYELKNREKRKAQKAATEKSAKTRQYRSNWRKNNVGKSRSYCMKYWTTKIQRTPKWLTKTQLKEIEQFYLDAAYLTNYTKTPFEVDHIVPLQGKNVSGLHVPWNLQILTQSENCSKGNR